MHLYSLEEEEKREIGTYLNMKCNKKQMTYLFVEYGGVLKLGHDVIGRGDFFNWE